MKSLEKENQTKYNSKYRLYEDVLNKENIFEKEENTKEQQYLFQLYHELALMYFHCHISFPLVEIDFNKEENFNSDKMIDFINRGKNRKVNFVILPSLISNGNFLQNGKYWVFTFTNNTFKFKDTMNEILNGILDKTNYDIDFIKNNLKITVICRKNKEGKVVNILTNYDIPDNIKYEFIFYFYDKKNNQKHELYTNLRSFQIEKDYQIIKYEFALVDKKLIFSDKVINE